MFEKIMCQKIPNTIALDVICDIKYTKCDRIRANLKFFLSKPMFGFTLYFTIDKMEL